jgi:hypothetical protein
MVGAAMTIIDTRVQGIPCHAELLHYSPGSPGYISGPPESCYESEQEEWEYRILDRRGRPAPWLEAKVTDDDREQIESDFIKAFHEERNYI